MDNIVNKIIKRVTAETPSPEPPLEEVGDLEVAEYLVFLLALDTYMRCLHEMAGPEMEDDVARRGITLVRMADRQHSAAIRSFLDEHVSTSSQKKMLAKAFKLLPTKDGLERRALQLRTVLSRGGAATMRAIFKTNKALAEIRTAIAASMVEDARDALDKFATIKLRNSRLRGWVDHASNTAGSGTFQNAVAAASRQTADDSASLLAAKVHQTGAAANSEAAVEAAAVHEDQLTRAQQDATDAAAKAMAVSGEPDEPPKKSEVVGIAAAAALAAVSDPSRTANVPPSLQSLDPEQRSAAMTDGRVLVAAGAGSGKTTTLTSRVAYLVQERHVDPGRIFVVSFNRKAARELRERIASKVGDEALRQMNVGTMHGMFRKFITEYGLPEEKAALTTWLMTSPSKKAGDQEGRMGRAPTPASFGGYMGRIWKECKGDDPPRGVKNVIQQWLMNDVTPDQAMAAASSEEERTQAEWYRWTQGFKGVDKRWQPPCASSNPKAGKAWGEFLAKWRDNGRARLGDFNDMILLFRDLLKRDPNVRRKVQSMFDHICVDEAQDLNAVQHQIIDMMGEHITDGKDGKSLFLVGDEIQSVNAFVGARPELFGQFHGRDGWVTKSIRTNYRCLPEIVETANRLMGDHPRLIPMESKPDDSKPRGSASIVVQNPPTHAAGAIGVISQIKQDVDAGAPIEDHAVLTRTNMEMNDYETACIIQGVPYARRGGTSFLRSPETITVMSYFNLAVSQDFSRMQKSLIEVFNKPNRFFLRAGEAERIINDAVEKKARRNGTTVQNVNPLDLFDDDGINLLIDVMDPQRRWESWKVRATREELEELGHALHGMRRSVEEGKTVTRSGESKSYTTQDLFGDILKIEGVPERRGSPAPTLRDVLMPAISSNEEDSDAPPDPDDDSSKKPIGNVEFLFQIAQPDPSNMETDPSDPVKFKARIDKLVEASKDLRVDLDAWDRQQQSLPPAERKSPPCVTLSTIHSVKGAQWNNTTVVMAKGVFPFEPKRKSNEAMLSPEALAKLEEKRHKEFLTERQLAYVAMTRAAKNLTIVCPGKSAYGRDAGVSRFVEEAGLSVGQNVAGKNDPTPEPTPVTTVLSHFVNWPPESASSEPDEAVSYDRSRA